MLRPAAAMVGGHRDLGGMILALGTANKFIAWLDTSRRTQQVAPCLHGNTGWARATLGPITGL